MQVWYTVLVAVACFAGIVLAYARARGVTSPGFQAVAHLYVAALLVGSAAIFRLDWIRRCGKYKKCWKSEALHKTFGVYYTPADSALGWLLAGLAVFLTAVEVYAFIALRR